MRLGTFYATTGTKIAFRRPLFMSPTLYPIQTMKFAKASKVKAKSLLKYEMRKTGSVHEYFE